jgi:glycosyltransferase involved in cell wall biosynthesis
VTKPQLIVIGPLPPPTHGVTVSTSLVLANADLKRSFDLTHVDTSDHRDGTNIGRWDVTNVVIGLGNIVSLLRALRGKRGTVYLPISQSAGAFLRDSLLIRVARLRGWRVAIHLRGSEILELYESRGRLFRLWARATLRGVTAAAVMGESLRGAFGQLIPPDRVAVVPNGTPRPARRSSVRNGSTVLFLSNLRRRKGVVEALEAARITAAEVPHARFLFVGAWEDEQLEMDLRARAAPLGDRVRFQSPVYGPTKDALLASASLLLFPPRKPEGHPRVVIEAIAAGLPVVTTDEGAISETIADDVNGFVVDSSDPVAIADRLTRLLLDDELRARMSSAALATYETRFTQEIADATLADWLQSVSRVGNA